MNRKNRKAIVAGNWKMNMLPSGARGFADELKSLMPKVKTCETLICAPYVIIPALQRAFRETRVAVGAQDVSEHEKGAYTGEVSADMLGDLGLKYTIVGHSERRQYFSETDYQVNTKVLALLERGISPIVCVGESLEQRERGLTYEHIAYQVKAAFTGVPEEKMRKCVIAYEPIWAIGTGKTATAEQAEEVCAHIRSVVRSVYGAKVARSISILYGGSMNAKNAYELLAQPDIDGGLIGGASLKPADFAKIIEATNQE